ncbi:hypothetical protein GH714_027191 [Hevea brasiliensis]|uniref:E3 ubiquitin protein ligase n=1 Tax=Hevea brasiliensis TaxID=3981 RepID=A0A6A6MQR4_HEVBR|nr:hypothetical protein GH714_027191 [Hevea brasiliensis]
MSELPLYLLGDHDSGEQSTSECPYTCWMSTIRAVVARQVAQPSKTYWVGLRLSDLVAKAGPYKLRFVHQNQVDVAVLQEQNQKLVQQLDIQKHELHDLEAKIQELTDKQTSYDDVLILVNQLWNQLVDDLVLLGVLAGGGQDGLETLNHSGYSGGTDSIQSGGNNGIVGYVEEALSSRHSSTMKLMKILEDTIDAQRVKTESIAQALLGNLSTEGELEEIMAELEESRRKLVNLKMQKDAAARVHTPASSAVNGSLTPEKPAEKSKGLRELKDSIEEAKILVADRLSEFQEAQDENHILTKESEKLQDELKDDKYIHSSRLYNLVNDQLQHWHAEAERYKSLTDSLQADRSLVVRREKEVNAKVESADSARNIVGTAEPRIEELELQLQKCILRKMTLRLKWKKLCRIQTNEQKCLTSKCAEQMSQIKSLKTLIEKLQKEKLELQIILDMYGQEGYDTRDMLEIKESERKAHSQAEVLRSALDEHSLELRVKAANEAEAACQQRLSTAEAEIVELRAKLDTSERDVWELTEAIKSKDREAEAYISEIETIGQAYEDMQTQNQHLLQQVTDRDDYNIKMKVCLAEAIRSTEEDRHVAVNLETARWELMDAEKELKWLKYAGSSSEKEYEQIQKKIDEVQTELHNERSERKKLEEELKELNDKIAEMSSESGEAAIQRLQEELKECKSMLKCSVCSDRPKEVVIVKCYHLFCNPCIQRNLEIRHRKCPGCGTAFGQSDVRKEAADRRKLVSKWHPTTKGTLKRTVGCPPNLKEDAFLKQLHHYSQMMITLPTPLPTRREGAHGESVCCNNVRALFDELPTAYLVVEITDFPAGPLTVSSLRN